MKILFIIRVFFTFTDNRRYKLWFCQNVCDVLTYLLNNIYVKFSTILCREIDSIPMGTTFDPLVADCFYFAKKEIK